MASFDRHLSFSSYFGNSRDGVLLYHSIGRLQPGGYAWDLSVEQFRAQISTLADRFEFVDLSELLEADAKSKRFAVTFDDAFRNVYQNAIPILREYEIPATVFVCPEFIGNEDRGLLLERHGLSTEASNIVMRPDQLSELADDDLFTLGNHTATHPDLSRVDDPEKLRDEIVGSKNRIERQFDVTVDQFSYPYGAISERAEDIVADSHQFAVTSDPSLVPTNPDPYRIPRLDGCLPLETLQFEVTDLGDRLRRIWRSIRF